MLQTIRRHPYGTLFLFSLYLYLMGNSLLAVTDTAESNYALTAKEMVLSGDWLSPQIYGRYWYDKPIFYYWELAASFSLFGVSEWAARLPSALLGCANVLFTFWFARRVYGEKTAWGAAILLGTSLEFYLLSKAVITDAALFFFMSAAVAFFFLGYTENRAYYYLCWLFAGLAVLTKGPIGIALPGLSCLLFLIYKKDLREMGHVHLFSGLLLFLLTSGPWYFYMYLTHGSDFLLNFFGVHNFLRATAAEHARQNVWWFYLVMFLAGFAPWSFTAPHALYKGWKARHRLSLTDADRFLLLWAFSVLLVFQLIATKYTTYTFPSLFAFSILFARLYERRLPRLARIGAVMLAVYTAVSLAAAPSLMLAHSGKAIARALSVLPAGNAPVYFYEDYRTSAVFYSGQTISRLTTAREENASKPGGLSWNAKNVMPYTAIEELQPGVECYVITEKKRSQRFLSAVKGTWKQESAAGDYEIYKGTVSPDNQPLPAKP